MTPPLDPAAGVLQKVLQSRRTGRVWIASGVVLIGLAVLVPNAAYPLLTLVSLIGATAAGYLAPRRRTVLWLAFAALVAACAVWIGEQDFSGPGMQWLSAAIVLILATAAVTFYVRVLEDRAFEYGWRAEMSAEAADLGVFRWAFESDQIHASKKLRRLLFLPSGGPIAADDAFARVHPDDIADVRRAVDDARRPGGVFRSEFRVTDDGGQVRWISARGKVIADARSGDLSLAGVNYDITDVKERESLVGKLIDGVGALFAITTPEGAILELNEYGEKLSDTSIGIWRDTPFADLAMWGRTDEERAPVRDLIRRAREEGRVTGEAPFWITSGDQCWALITVTPIASEKGETLHLCICAVDITKRKTAEESNALLVQELNHRIKNLFSVTNALISLSARHASTVDQFAEATRRRLFALHAAHNIGAVDLRKREADLREILNVTLRPWRTDPPRIFLPDEPCHFDAGAATAWALIAHELASNAAKYGSLRDARGRLYINWTDSADGFVFEWKEISPPSSSWRPPGEGFEGFGVTIIDRLVSGFLSGVIEREMTPEGACITIRIAKHED